MAQRVVQFNMRLTPKEHQRALRLAEKREFTVATLLRQLLKEEHERIARAKAPPQHGTEGGSK